LKPADAANHHHNERFNENVVTSAGRERYDRSIDAAWLSAPTGAA